ncbi:MAG TPA: argininosuccinate lyase, partial [Methanolinea sp.]|nr:argininosuccinate lyase [Methanolinea sp.]
TDLADMLVRRLNLPFRTAHSIVGRAVQKGGLDLSTLDSASVEITGEALRTRGLTVAEVDEALDVETAIASRKATGGPSPVAVKSAIKEQQMMLEKEREDLERINETYSGAVSALIRDARGMAGE